MDKLIIAITFEVTKAAQEKWMAENKLWFRVGNLLWKDFIQDRKC